MTFGAMNQKNKLLLLLLFLFTFPTHALESKIELSELLHLFSQQRQSTVDFKEEKHTSFLEQPIISSGQLQFIAPDQLFKFILKPEKISHKITADELEIKNKNKTHTINLNDHPEFSVILRSIISVLSGDHAALKKDFKINFDGNLTSWNLLLLPHDSFIADHVESIKFLGNNNKLTEIIVTEPNQDRSVTRIYNHR